MSCSKHPALLLRRETWWVSLYLVWPAPLRYTKDRRMSNAALFIDGSNFYNRLKDLGIRNTAQFDYRGLAE